MEAPTPEDVREALAGFDVRRQKIVAGMLGLMIQEPTRVREREWIAEQLTQITLYAGEFEADSPQEGVRAVQSYLQENASELLNACFLLFQRVGLELAPRASEGFTFDEAMRQALVYLPSVGIGEGGKAEVVRDLGEQPLARLMAEKGLKPADLVVASGEQITHKMVSRAMKGRRLTANTMGKVHRAWNRASGGDQAIGDLFDYQP